MFKLTDFIVFTGLFLIACSKDNLEQIQRPNHFCDKQFSQFDMKTYTIDTVESRIAIYVYEEYLSSEYNCNVINENSNMIKVLDSRFGFIAPETHLFYQCKTSSVSDVFALAYYVSGEYSPLSNESSNFCMLDPNPLGRLSYVINFRSSQKDYKDMQILTLSMLKE